MSSEDEGCCGILALVREYEEQQKPEACAALDDNVVIAAEDLLQRLLSELAQLADPAVVATAASLQHPQDDELLLPTMADQIWNMLLGQETTLSSSIIAMNHKVRLADEKKKKQAATEQQRLRTRWEQGLRLASRLVMGTEGNTPPIISATELHTVAASSMVFAARSCNDGCILFPTTCLLLCCHALRQCPTPSIETRWRRWQSLQLETVRLFQQHFLLRGRTTTKKDATNLWVSSTLDVACRHLLPALAHVQQALMLSTTISSSSTVILPTTSDGEAGGPPPPPRWMVLEAGTVWCVARLAVFIVAAAATNNNKSDAATARAQKQLHSLWVAVDRHILRGRYELLYEHPWWRCRREQEPTQDDETTTNSTSPSSSDAAVLAYYTTDLVLDDSTEAEEERRDQVLGLQTIWSDLGIAILAAAVGWTERPSVWTAEYQWRMFFPHVAVLLLAQYDDDEDDPFGSCCYDKGEDAAAECVELESNNSSDGINGSVMIVARLLGFDLLHNLLQHTPDRSAVTPGSRHAPDCPIGTLQLIANQIIVSGSISALEQGQASKRGTLPNASRSFQLMRSLVGKYCPAYQVTIVQTLYLDCPHPGLRPKLVDLLRSFVTWEDESAVQDVWLFLDTQVLSSLANHVDGVFSTNSGPTDVSSWSSSVEELVNHVEVYSAALGLIQLWLLCVRKAPTTAAMSSAVLV